MKTRFDETRVLIHRLLRLVPGERLFVPYGWCTKSGVKSSVKSAHARMKDRGLKYRLVNHDDGALVEVAFSSCNFQSGLNSNVKFVSISEQRPTLEDADMQKTIVMRVPARGGYRSMLCSFDSIEKFIEKYPNAEFLKQTT